jgi:predicted Zn-dependent protease
MRWSPFLLVLAAAPLYSQQLENPQKLGDGPNLYSREKEAALGAALAAQVERNSPPAILPEGLRPEALRYVQQVGARLAEQLPDAPFPYTFALIGDNSDPSQEPIALPGGYVFVPTRLFLNARDEAEFAGVLAHAMAHVADRQGTRQATKSTLNQLATIPLIFYLGPTGAGNGQTSSVAIPIAFLQFSNAYEQRADALAVRMASGAGYDAEGLLRYLSRMHASDPADRSISDARVAAVRMALQNPPPANSNDEFFRIQDRLRNPKN